MFLSVAKLRQISHILLISGIFFLFHGFITQLFCIFIQIVNFSFIFVFVYMPLLFVKFVLHHRMYVSAKPINFAAKKERI